MELLKSEVIGNDEDYERLIVLVERAGFFHALALLHEKKRRFDLIFETYLKDPAKKVIKLQPKLLILSCYNIITFRYTCFITSKKY